MGSGPLVSICIPSYNNESFIALTLESVLRQSYANFELIITDDSSTDGTVAVIRRYTDSRINLIQNESNLGMGANWNKALSSASGAYVKLLCADDLMYPDCLAHQVEALENPSNRSAVLAACSTNVINAAGEIVLRRKNRFRQGLVNGPKIIRSCVRWGTNLIGEPVAGLFRREVLARPVAFDPANPYLIDLHFWSALLKHGDAWMDNRFLGAFRISGKSVSAKVGFSQAARFRDFVRRSYADPVHHASLMDVLMGCFFSFQWCILRNLVIKFHARKTH